MGKLLHETYMQRCLQIGKNALGSAAPNPMVGCVIVHDNNILSEGYTSAYGSSHAEVNAINNVTNKELLKKATLYVSLEPCAHHGKTPPCAELIVKNQIPKVVIGCLDPNPEVAGKGVEILKQHGIEVVIDVLEAECKKHFKRFFTFLQLERPYIILKWAQSADGFIAPLNKETNVPVLISNTYSRQLTHKWRSEEQAILVGVQTVADDNPSLTTRHWVGKNPTRVVIDPKKRVDVSSTIFDSSAMTLHLPEDVNDSVEILTKVLKKLYQEKITSVIIEGGSKTLRYFIESNLWDEARVFSSEINLGTGIKAPNISKEHSKKLKIASDILYLYENN